jgi:hypothetical protein
MCPIYTHEGANAKFSTNLGETDYSVSTPCISYKDRLTVATLSFYTYPILFFIYFSFSKCIPALSISLLYLLYIASNFF